MKLKKVMKNDICRCKSSCITIRQKKKEKLFIKAPVSLEIQCKTGK